MKQFISLAGLQEIALLCLSCPSNIAYIGEGVKFLRCYIGRHRLDNVMLLLLHRSCPRRHTYLTVLILVLTAQLRLRLGCHLGALIRCENHPWFSHRIVVVIVYCRLILILIIIFSHLIIVKEILAIVMNLFLVHCEEADGSCLGILLCKALGTAHRTHCHHILHP